MSTENPDATPAPRTATVRLLATLEPSATDKTRYDAGTDWTFPEDRALELVEAGLAELLSDAPAAAPAAEPALFVDADEE